MLKKKKKRRRRKYQKFMYKPDFLYQSYWMTKFLNKFMKSGKKYIVEKTTFNAFKNIKKKTRQNNLYLFLAILIKFRPLLGFISKRFGKQFKKIPVPLYPRRQTIISLKWLIASIKVNKSFFFETRISSEFLDFKAGKKTSLSKRYLDHFVEINEHRLNNRFRWK